jgi:hypothetical protein
VARRVVLACEFGASETAEWADLRHSFGEAISVGEFIAVRVLAVVLTEGLFVYVTE